MGTPKRVLTDDGFVDAQDFEFDNAPSEYQELKQKLADRTAKLKKLERENKKLKEELAKSKPQANSESKSEEQAPKQGGLFSRS